MRILILGGSGTGGTGLADPGKTWVAQLPARLEAQLGAIEIANRVFFPNGERALTYLDRMLSQERPEMVIAHLSTWPFTVMDVSYAVRDRFGNRAQAIFDTTEAGFRAVARRTGAAGKATDTGAKGLARRLLGRAPIVTEAVATGTWLAALDRLAREEDVQTFVEAPFTPAPEYQRLYPEALATRARFTSTIKDRAEHHHFGWIDVEPAIAAAPGGLDACMTPDLVHRNELGHSIALEGIAAAILARHPD